MCQRFTIVRQICLWAVWGLLAGYFLSSPCQAQTPTPTPEPNVVKVSHLDDLNFSAYSGSGNVSLEDPVCVYNSAGSSYSVTFFEPSNSFLMSAGANTLPFHVRFKESNGSYVTFSPNQTTVFSGADTSSQSCGGSDNAVYEISLQQSQLLAARPGSYSGSVTLIVGQP